MYKSATTPAEYFRLHPGPTDATGRVAAAADWKNDVKKKLVVFEDHRYRSLAEHYGMQGGELEEYFDQHPEELQQAKDRATRNIFRCFAMSVADELDLMPDEVCHVQGAGSLSGPKAARQYFNTVDVDESAHDSLIYNMIVHGDLNEVYLRVEFDKNRDHNRLARDDPKYKPKPADIVIHEGMLRDLRDVTDPVERARMVKAIVKEIADLCAIGTFELCPAPCGRQPIPSRLVLKVKYFADGTYNKHKARLVAKGFMQRLGVDFFSVFSPMATLTTVRVLLALAVHLGLLIIHADIPQAFVQSLLNVDVWMQLPDGILLKDAHDKENKAV